MEVGKFRTQYGDIWLWGERRGLQRDAPVVLAIAGVFAKPDAFWFRLQQKLPEATVLAAQLPGHFSPQLSEVSVQAYAAAFGEVLQNQVGGRPILVVGDSIGGVVALAIPNPGLMRLVLDPPLRTAFLWSMQSFCERIYAQQPDKREFLEKIFAFDGTKFGDVDYTPLIHTPARVLMGEIPRDPPREWQRMPSLLGEEERQILMAAPGIRTSLVRNIGHVIVWFEEMLVQVIRDELARVLAAHEAGAPRWG